jgi:FHA domain
MDPAGIDRQAAELLRVPSGYYVTCGAGDLVPLEPDQPLVIGRCARTAGLVIDSEQVSRAHAEVALRRDQLTVRDLGSTNGTFLGTTRLGPHPTQLLPGVRFRIGGVALQVRGGASQLRQLLQGLLAHRPLRELVLEVERQRQSGFVDVRGPDLSGRITFLDGRPCRANSSAGDDGTRAIRRLLRLEQGRFLMDAHIACSGAKGAYDRPRTFTKLVVDELVD